MFHRSVLNTFSRFTRSMPRSPMSTQVNKPIGQTGKISIEGIRGRWRDFSPKDIEAVKDAIKERMKQDWRTLTLEEKKSGYYYLLL